jgi:hypothetical protein
MTSWVGFGYTAAALITATLLVYVMQKVEEDRWSKTDPLWLQWLRRAAFVSTALALLYSIHSTDWQFTCFVLVSASGVILAINALALHLRAPPRDGRHARYHSNTLSYVVSVVANYFHVHR